MGPFKFVISIFYTLFFNPYNGIDTNPLENASPPNIVVIMTDDMGWNDVGYLGSNEIPTPNIDALALNGVILNHHYTLPTCTPSRTAFLTGRHPIRMGMQGLPLSMAEPRGIPLNEKLMPEYLKELGYVTRLLGKWHVGYYTEKHTPTRRGFDSFVGYYGGYVNYFNHQSTKNKHTGVDFHMDGPQKIEPYNNSQYVTDLIADESEKIIKNHDKKKPLYLHISHLAGHASEYKDLLEVRDATEVNDTLGYIPDIKRRKYAGMITAMDDSVGRVVKALSEASMLSNSIIIFTSDNGAPTTPLMPFANYGSNYPLRGVKSTLFEGGVRVPSFVFSPLIKKRSRILKDYVHITDWLPTLYKLAGGNLSTFKDIDGIDQWSAISDGDKGKRKAVFLNIDEVRNDEAAIVEKYKLVKTNNYYNNYYGQSGNDYSPKIYNATNMLSSLAGKAVEKLPNYKPLNSILIRTLRKAVTINCEKKHDFPKCIKPCLFNIVEDPCETNDLSKKQPQMVDIIKNFIDSHRSILINQTNDEIQSRGYPENFNSYWMPWLDNENIPSKNRNFSAIHPTDIFCEGFPINDPRRCF